MKNFKLPDNWIDCCTLLKSEAERKGITHALIADLTGLQATNVTRTLNARYTPSIETFLKITKAIDVELFVNSNSGK